MKSTYGIIKKPCLTEKGISLQEECNHLVLRVDPRANKIEIKQAVESMFNVEVEKVRTANMHGKKKRIGRNMGRRSDWKKAIVSLAEGHSVDFLQEI